MLVSEVRYSLAKADFEELPLTYLAAGRTYRLVYEIQGSRHKLLQVLLGTQGSTEKPARTDQI